MRKIITKATLIAMSTVTLVAIGINMRADPAIAGGNSSTVQATAKATVVEPLTITKNNDLNFGSFSVNGMAGSISSEGVTDNTTLVPGENNSQANANFTVKGSSGYSYGITIPNKKISVIDKNNTDAELDVSGPTERTLNGGVDDFEIYGILSVNGNETPGTYTSADFDITVHYE